jgi:hypothetical protein
MLIAFNWAMPIFADLRMPGLCAETTGCSHAETITVNLPPTLIFAIVAASTVTVLLAGLVLRLRRMSRPGMSRP